MLGYLAHDGVADDDAVGEGCHVARLLGRGDAEADGAGDGGVRLAHLRDELGDVGAQVAAHAGDAEAAHAVDESFGFAGDHLHAAGAGGRHHADERHACRTARFGELGFLLVRHVG